MMSNVLLQKKTKGHGGYLLVLVLVFGAIFFTIATAMMGSVITQKQVQDAKRNDEKALSIAEAGLNYYKWYLAHNPGDTTNGGTDPQPFVVPYHDPEAGAIGEYSLNVSSNGACGDVTSVDIYSEGHTYEDPDRTRELYARYAQPTVSEYAYIINSNVWAGSDRTIIGPYHSNGAIRMDGTNNSTVSSGLETYVCGGSGALSCDPDPSGSTVDAVYGDGPNFSLWETAVPPVNFAGITLDLANMKTLAIADGRYFDASGDFGYLVDFQNNNTFNIYRVTGTESYEAYNSEDGDHTERNVITSTVADAGNPYSIPTGCSVIYIEDKVWLEGDISTKVTITAADTTSTTNDPSIILNDNITYTDDDSGLLAIAEDNVLVGLQVPNDMELNGIFVAQEGRFGRNHYETRDLSSALDPYVTRTSLTIHGSIVSNGRVGTKWTSGGTWVSGFGTRYNSYDRDLVTDPPPLTPTVSDTYEFIEWREE